MVIGRQPGHPGRSTQRPTIGGTKTLYIPRKLIAFTAVLTAPACAASSSDQTSTGFYRIACPFPVEGQTGPGNLNDST